MLPTKFRFIWLRGYRGEDLKCEKLTDDRRRTPSDAVDDQTLSFLVPKLIEGTPYQFRVLAVNDEGASEPLITDTEIKPKKAPGNQQLYERRCGLKR
jgi:hypothetical protein